MSSAPVGFDHARDAAWLTAYADGELTPEQVSAVAAHLTGCATCRDELARLRRFDLVMDSLRLREAPPEAWEDFWTRFAHRAERGLGWALLAIGIAVACGGALWLAGAALWGAASLPWWVKVGILASAAGLLLLLTSALRERLHVRRRTRYKDIVR